MGEARQHYNVTLAILALAGLAYALQQTMIVPALPSLQRDFHTSTGWVTWLLTSFLLVSAVATPVLGKLGDQYGKERFLLLSLLVFFVGCVAAIFAWNIWSLIAFRAIQGFGGAVFPLSFAIVFDEFPPDKVGSGVGMVSAILGVGGGLGLVLSGVLVDYASWRWIFIVGAVFVGVAAIGVWRFVPESPVKTPSKPDPVGAVAALGGARHAAARPDRGTGVGLGLDPRGRAVRCVRGARRCVGARRAARARADGRHPDDDAAHRALHQPGGDLHRLCDVRRVRAPAVVHADGTGRQGRLRLRAVGDRDGPLPAAGAACSGSSQGRRPGGSARGTGRGFRW